MTAKPKAETVTVEIGGLSMLRLAELHAGNVEHAAAHGRPAPGLADTVEMCIAMVHRVVTGGAEQVAGEIREGFEAAQRQRRGDPEPTKH